VTVLDEVVSILRTCSRDELAAFAVIARKVMGPGRVAYGPTDLTVDRRDFRREAADEIVDAVWYWALDEVRRQMTRRNHVSLTNLIWDLRELAFEGFSRGWDGLDQKDKHAEIDRVVDSIKALQSDSRRARVHAFISATDSDPTGEYLAAHAEWRAGEEKP